MDVAPFSLSWVCLYALLYESPPIGRFSAIGVVWLWHKGLLFFLQVGVPAHSSRYKYK